MEEKLEQLTRLVDAMAKQQTYLIANNSALTAVVRALAEANAQDPVFQTALKIGAESRKVAQLNSAQSDEGIDAFNAALNALLPRGLREI
ncbi:hypothetical protein [Paraburkholderia sp. BL21I4N1]|uniref:hypothetical protein n=1 Tax=Paraburkholderia sp. BL21I4N1 TaxID=1938801 RepID=UPI000CFADF3B|nr:hypothetical protein [Paraburkholderia sp. BL21I4N1]PQV51000.1 hypothetical protein B0G83_105363 [Paraburkholderia sp. BL21I4N1]